MKSSLTAFDICILIILRTANICNFQLGKIEKVIERPGAKTFLIAPDAEKGCSALAYFRAGQYISVALDIGEARLCKPYTIACGPKAAMGETGNTYALTVKESAGGFGSAYILNNWVQGTEVLFSAPLGDFYYNSLRDAKNVIAIAGGSGITPFLSMAEAIADRKFNWVHPCSTYPLSNIEIEVFPLLEC